MKTNGTKDIVTLCMEALFSAMGAFGLMALAALMTGSHIPDWNGRMAGGLFIVLTLGIWALMEISQILEKKKINNGKRKKCKKNDCENKRIMVY